MANTKHGIHVAGTPYVPWAKAAVHCGGPGACGKCAEETEILRAAYLGAVSRNMPFDGVTDRDLVVDGSFHVLWDGTTKEVMTWLYGFRMIPGYWYIMPGGREEYLTPQEYILKHYEEL